MGMGDFRAAERKSNSYSRPNSTKIKSNSQPQKSSVTQNKKASTKSTSTSGVQLTKSGGATASTRPQGMGDLKKAESSTNKNSTIRSSGTSQPSRGMGDLRVAESKTNKSSTTRSASTSQPSQGMGDLKVAEFKNSNSNKSQIESKANEANDLKKLNAGLAVVGLAAGGAALVVEAPAVVIGASAVSVVSGVIQAVNNEIIRQAENKPIDRDYIINQALTIPAAFASTAAMAGKILNVSSKTEQVLNGVDNVTNLSTGPAGTTLSINDLFSKTTTNKTTTKHITPPKDRSRMLKEKSLRFHAY